MSGPDAGVADATTPSADRVLVNGPAILSLADISKSFGQVRALQDVTVECRAGEVHAVLGENGSGKSTLFGVASGMVRADSGEVRIAGEPLHLGDAGAARRMGLAMAYQTYSLVPELSVAHNLLVSAPADRRPDRFTDAVEWAAAELSSLGIGVDPGAPVAALRLAERQLLEVAKALIARPRVLLLDEPTTALGPAEVDQLHALVTDQVTSGIGVMYVSHRLPEILSIADRVTVLRDGVSQGTFDAREVSEQDLVAIMIGRPVELAFPTSSTSVAAPVALEARDLAGERFGPVSLEVRNGEIVGLAGAEGNGQHRILRTIAGLEPPTSGDVRVAGAVVDHRSPGRALADGVMFLSGERLRESLFPVLGVRANSSVQVLERFSRLGWLRRRAETAAVEGATRAMRLRAASVEQPVRFLSGGNQQKVVLTRPFLHDVAVLLIEEPTQGVDVGSRFEIYEAMRARAAAGLAVVVQSSDPIELAGLCDRVFVVSRGRIVGHVAGEDLDEAQIVDAIVRAESPDRRLERPIDPAVDPTVPADPAVDRRHAGGRPWVPVVVLLALATAIGAYTASRSDSFLTEFNLRSLLLLAVPLALASMGQLNALLVGQFDVSIGGVIGFTVVCSSFLLTSSSWWVLALGIPAVLAIALGVGLVNAGLVRLLSIPSIVATIATLSVLQGVSLMLRPTPGGLVSGKLLDVLTARVGFVPYTFIAVVVGAVVLDVWLHRTRDGLVTRAVGYDETAARRLGASPGVRHVRAFAASALFGALAGLALGALVGIGDARLGGSYTLSSIAAAVLGGAALSGGRGSFVGALVGALFFSLILNVLPFLGWGSAWGDIARGGITLAALVAFQGGRWSAVLPSFRRRPRA